MSASWLRWLLPHIQAASAAKTPSYASLPRAPAADVSGSMSASWLRPALPSLLATTELSTSDYFQKAKDRQAYTLTNLSQCEEISLEVPRTGTPEPSEAPPRVGLEARIIKLERKVATMDATTPKHKAKRSRPRARKTRIGRHAAQDQTLTHSSGTPCCQFMQNSGVVFPAHDLSVPNSHGWSGVAHAACTNIPSPHTPARIETRSKLGVNTAGRALVNTVWNAIAWIGERGVTGLLHEVARCVTGSHGQGGG